MSYFSLCYFCSKTNTFITIYYETSYIIKDPIFQKMEKFKDTVLKNNDIFSILFYDDESKKELETFTFSQEKLKELIENKKLKVVENFYIDDFPEYFSIEEINEKLLFGIINIDRIRDLNKFNFNNIINIPNKKFIDDEINYINLNYNDFRNFYKSKVYLLIELLSKPNLYNKNNEFLVTNVDKYQENLLSFINENNQ